MTPDQIAELAIQKTNKNITDLVFLEIQKDRDLMGKYLRCVENKGLDKTNQTIGKAVKEAYSLENADDREDSPSCTLIQSHQRFE